MKGYHFYRRVKHQESLSDRKRDVVKVLKSMDTEKIHVHDSHVHIFLKGGRSLSKRVRQVCQQLESLDIPWNDRHLLEPIASLEPHYVNRLLKDLHSPPLI